MFLKKQDLRRGGWWDSKGLSNQTGFLPFSLFRGPPPLRSKKKVSNEVFYERIFIKELYNIKQFGVFHLDLPYWTRTLSGRLPTTTLYLGIRKPGELTSTRTGIIRDVVAGGTGRDGRLEGCFKQTGFLPFSLFRVPPLQEQKRLYQGMECQQTQLAQFVQRSMLI